jgi:putative transposase
MRGFQTFVAVRSSIHNLINTERSLSSSPVYKSNRAAALAEWRGLRAD